LLLLAVLKTIKHKEREDRHRKRVVKKDGHASIIEMVEVIRCMFFVVVFSFDNCTMFLKRVLIMLVVVLIM
jgi:hypothetical protein